jgi:ATP-dependent DNA helicase RecQ
MKEHSEAEVRNLVYQLVHQGLLHRTEGDRPILRLNRESVAVLKGELEVRLQEPAIKARAAPKEPPVTGDAGLFERLRALRREIARERGIPPYLVFNDRTLHEMSAYRPASRRAMSDIHGVGEVKLETYAEPFLTAIREWCEENAKPV